VVVDRTYDALMDGGRAFVLVGAGALVCCTGAAVLTAVAAGQVSDRADTSSLRQQALSAGRQIAVDFAAYDYRHLQADFERVASESTGTFKSQFASSAAGVQDLIIKAKTVSTAEVASAGVVDAGPGSATVVVAVNRKITNTSVPNGQKDSFGLQISLRHVNGRWLASQVKPL
jgi:Mce-associated membrane protein